MANFSSGAELPRKKYLDPKQSPSISHSDIEKDGTQLLLLTSVNTWA